MEGEEIVVRDGGRQRLSFYWFSPPPCLDSPVGVYPYRQVNIPTVRSVVLYSYSESDSSKDLCVHVSPNDCSDSCVGSWNRNSVSTWSCSAVVGNLPVYTRCTYVREF